MEYRIKVLWFESQLGRIAGLFIDENDNKFVADFKCADKFWWCEDMRTNYRFGWEAEDYAPLNNYIMRIASQKRRNKLEEAYDAKLALNASETSVWRMAYMTMLAKKLAFKAWRIYRSPVLDIFGGPDFNDPPSLFPRKQNVPAAVLPLLEGAVWPHVKKIITPKRALEMIAAGHKDPKGLAKKVLGQ